MFLRAPWRNCWTHLTMIDPTTLSTTETRDKLTTLDQQSQRMTKRTCVSHQWSWSLHTGPATATARSEPSSTTTSLSRRFTRSCVERRALLAAPGTAGVSRGTSGTDSCPMTPMMTVEESSWTGFSSPLVVSADAARIHSSMIRTES